MQCMSVGRVRYSEPFCDKTSGSMEGAGPEALPKLTIMPNFFRVSSESMKVDFPTES